MLFSTKKWLLFCIFYPILVEIAAQKDSSSLQISGYAEVYFSHDFQKSAPNVRPSFLYNHKRNREININLSFLKIAYSKSKTRANVAIMTGNYAQYNLAAEANIAQSLLEANVGLRLSKSQNLWLDAGVLPSHLGFESAISMDCPTLTRSLVAENSPYFETGARLSFLNKKGNFSTAFLILNGWQRMQRAEGNTRPSIGFQVNYKPKSGFWTLNYGNFVGSDKPDDAKDLRVYHNFYAIFDGLKKWSFVAGFDFGTDYFSAGKSKNWQTPVVILTHRFSEKFRVAGRAEYFNDPDGALIFDDFQLFGASINLDYLIEKNVSLRFEPRLLRAKKESVFGKKNQNWSAVLSLASKF